MRNRQGPPHSFGWLRRGDLDADYGGAVYEKPNGQLYVFGQDASHWVCQWVETTEEEIARYHAALLQIMRREGVAVKLAGDA